MDREGGDSVGPDSPTGRSVGQDRDVVGTREQQAAASREPLVVLEPLRGFLDAHDLGSGEVAVRPIGEGHSNVSYEVRRGDLRLVLRRPPRGPLAPSTHNVVREARLLRALAPAGVRVPTVRAVCEDPEVIGAPFYLMDLVEGYVLMTELPAPLRSLAAADRASVGPQLVEGLVELHAVDAGREEIAAFGRPDGYLERQLDRFAELLQTTATRSLPDLEWIAGWLRANLPASPAATVVHGDFRLGNAMLRFRPGGADLVAILDWEMSTIGDPIADVGYLTAMWAERGDPDNPMFDLSSVTRLEGFSTRAELAELYGARTGRALDRLAWYQVLALWKAAIFLEGSYARYVAGRSDDPYFARLGEGVPKLARYAMERARRS